MNPTTLFSAYYGLRRAAFLLVLALSAQAVTATAQTIIVQDSFTLNGTSRVAGGSLAPTSPEQQVGGNVWKTASGIASGVFTAGGAITTKQNNYPTEMRIGIAQPSTEVTVSASIVVGNAAFTAIGFLTTDNGTTSSWLATGSSADSALWVYITPTGSWNIYINGTTTKISSGSISGFSASSTYTLGLTYVPDTQMARAFLVDSGGTETSLYASNGGWFASGVAATSIAATGFRIHSIASTTTGSPVVDDFLVASTSTIPEPSSVALLAGGIILAMVVGRRRILRRA
ncbi:MAG: PEP-CTERM sorting domain-containing protein [Opitutaceae bacterium]|jgi:hypothetical protein